MELYLSYSCGLITHTPQGCPGVTAAVVLLLQCSEVTLKDMDESPISYTDPAWLSLINERKFDDSKLTSDNDLVW